MDSNSLLARKEIVNTTNTVGWKLICELAERTVMGMERKAIDEDDEEKGARLRREAKAARVFLNEFITTVGAHRNVDVDVSPEESFLTYGG